MMEFLKINVRQQTIDPEASEIIKKDKCPNKYTYGYDLKMRKSKGRDGWKQLGWVEGYNAYREVRIRIM